MIHPSLDRIILNNKYKDLSNAIRFLSIDAVEKANSGHPGMPMGMADVVTILYKDFCCLLCFFLAICVFLIKFNFSK